MSAPTNANNGVYNANSTQQPAAICALKSPADAIHILEAVRLGLVPRVTRRLTGHERSMIRAGTVWVWEEEETNMRRWTDGRRWGASRVGGGGFLVYTESSESLSPPSSRPESPYPYPNGGFYPGPSKKSESLIKQTYSTTMTHPQTGKVKKFHVVAYSSKHNPQGDAHNPLPLPHQLPLLASVKVTPGIWPEWEHRRDEASSRRTESAAPAASSAAPTTAIASPENNMAAFPPTAYPATRSPGGRTYPARNSPPFADPRAATYPMPYYYPPQDLDRRFSQSPYPPPPSANHPPPTQQSNERYHPYAGRPRQSYPPNAPAPYPVPTQTEMFDAEGRRVSPQATYHPYPMPQAYPAPEAYRRDMYPPVDPRLTGQPMSMPMSQGGMPMGYADPSAVAAAAQGGMMPQAQYAAQGQAGMSRSPATEGTPVTLPPLRVAIEDKNGRASPIPKNTNMPKLSPRVVSDGSERGMVSDVREIQA